MIDPMILAILEEEGYTDTKTGHINRVAKYIAKNYTGNVGNAEFEAVCIACGVDNNEFTQKDIEKIKEIISDL